MNMWLRDKLLVLAIGSLLALIAAFAVAAPRTPSAETAAFESHRGGEACQRGAIPAAPEHAPTCFEQHDPCGPGGIAPAPVASAAVHAMPSGGLVKAPALLSASMRDVAPHAAASLPILFRNFRE
jgi:hypothetical protein